MNHFEVNSPVAFGAFPVLPLVPTFSCLGEHPVPTFAPHPHPQPLATADLLSALVALPAGCFLWKEPYSVTFSIRLLSRGIVLKSTRRLSLLFKAE